MSETVWSTCVAASPLSYWLFASSIQLGTQLMSRLVGAESSLGHTGCMLYTHQPRKTHLAPEIMSGEFAGGEILGAPKRAVRCTERPCNHLGQVHAYSTHQPSSRYGGAAPRDMPLTYTAETSQLGTF